MACPSPLLDRPPGNAEVIAIPESAASTIATVAGRNLTDARHNWSNTVLLDEALIIGAFYNEGFTPLNMIVFLGVRPCPRPTPAIWLMVFRKRSESRVGSPMARGQARIMRERGYPTLSGAISPASLSRRQEAARRSASSLSGQVWMRKSTSVRYSRGLMPAIWQVVPMVRTRARFSPASLLVAALVVTRDFLRPIGFDSIAPLGGFSVAKWLLVSVVVALLVPVSVRAGDGLDVNRILSQAGVKLLAVEFYSAYCKPCMKAVPKWRKLHEKYHNKGLWLVVISADPGTCPQPDWSPDDVVCDEYGLIQNGWKVNTLPQAFLWDWQGQMVVSGGTVEDVERAVEKFYDSELRIAVNPPEDGKGTPLPNAAAVLTSVRGELSRMAKFELVATEEESEELREARKASFELDRSDKTRCKMGEEVSANSLLNVKLVETPKGQQLILELLSVERGCVTAFSKSTVVGGDVDRAVMDAVRKLVNRLVRFQDPKGVKRLQAAREEGEKGAKIALSVEPRDARWEMDSGRGGSGALEASKNVTVIQLSPGKHVLELSRDGYLPSSVELYVEDGELKTVQETLSPRVERGGGTGVGLLNVTSAPEDGARVFLDGKDTGRTTPVTLEDVLEGEHAVVLKRRFYKDKVERVLVPADDIGKVNVTMEPNFGSVRIDSNPAGADIYIDGVREGKTPYSKQRMESKAYKVKLSYALHHDLEATLFVQAGEDIKETFELPPAFGALEVRASGAGDELTGAKVTLDMEPKGATPAKLEKVRSGRYMVKVTYPMFRDFSEEVEVKDGQTAVVDADLDANFGIISVTATPSDSDIFIDGEKAGAGRVKTNVAVGEHTIKVTNKDRTFRPVEKKVAVALKERIAQEITLSQMVGSLMVFSEPAGGELSVNGRKVGTLPQKLKDLVVGPHTLRVEKKGFTPTEQVVMVTDGELKKVKIEMTQKATVAVTCAPGEGLIELDGDLVGRKKAEITGVGDGKHTLTCVTPGYVTAKRTFTASGGQRYSFELRLDTPALLRARVEDQRNSHKLWGWVGILGGAAFGGAAIWAGASYSSLSDDYASKETELATLWGADAETLFSEMRDLRTDIQLRSILGWSFAGAGVAAIAFGIYEFATTPDKASGYKVAPLWLPNGGGVTFGMGW